MPLAWRAVRSCADGEDVSDVLEDLGAVRLERVEGARLHQAFERPPVDQLRIDARGEIRQVLEGLRAARRDDVLDHLRADALQRGERVDDALAVRVEGDAGAVDVGRHDRDAEPSAPPGGIR